MESSSKVSPNSASRCLSRTSCRLINAEADKRSIEFPQSCPRVLKISTSLFGSWRALSA